MSFSKYIWEIPYKIDRIKEKQGHSTKIAALLSKSCTFCKKKKAHLPYLPLSVLVGCSLPRNWRGTAVWVVRPKVRKEGLTLKPSLLKSESGRSLFDWVRTKLSWSQRNYEDEYFWSLSCYDLAICDCSSQIWEQILPNMHERRRAAKLQAFSSCHEQALLFLIPAYIVMIMITGRLYVCNALI